MKTMRTRRGYAKVYQSSKGWNLQAPYGEFQIYATKNEAIENNYDNDTIAEVRITIKEIE